MSGMQLLELNDVRVFNLTAGKALPSWLSEKKRRQLLKRDVDLQRRIELIQDFEMPTAADCIRVSPDGEYIMAAGTYKPRIRCYDLDQMSLKFERHLNCEVVDMAYLSDNYSKQVFLMADRYVEVHASYGYHHRTRTPKNGRSIAYNHETCDLYVGATGPEIYRINLEQGRFLKSWTTQAPAVNKVLINDYYGMLAAGTTLGMVECFDPRARERIGVLDVTRGLSARAQRQLKGQIPAISTMTFMQDNLTLGVGTTGGQVLLYDIRAAEPVLTKDHSYGLPIKRIVHHAASDSVLAADQKVIKIWKRESGEAITAIEADADINDMDMYPDSGMFFVGGEQSKMMIYFVPSLGPAPKWCHYLDSITEELDDGAQPAVYDDYKFVTREELDALGLSSLVGTALLKAHMHGYFIDVRLYNEAKDASNPFAYEEYRQRLIRKKLEEGTESRLQLAKYRKELPKINRALAKRLVEFNENQAENTAAAADEKDTPAMSNPLGDDRFKALFSNPDFEIDINSDEYRLRHPAARAQGASDLLQEKFALVADEDDEIEGRASDEDSDDDLELVTGRKLYNTVPEATQEPKPQTAPTGQRAEKRRTSKKADDVTMYELKEGEEVRALTSRAKVTEQNLKRRGKSFASLLAKEPTAPRQAQVASTGAGGKVIRFETKKASEDTEAANEPSEAERKRAKRGVRSLGLSKGPKQKYWRGRPVKN